MKRGLIGGAVASVGLLGLVGAARAASINDSFENSADGWTSTLTNPSPAPGNNGPGNGWSTFAPWENNAGDGNSPKTYDGTGAAGSWQLAPNVSTFSNPCCPQDNLASTVITSSPVFMLDATGSITFALTGGQGGGAVAGNLSNYVSSPATSGGGFEGLALRNAATGAYILSQNHTENAESYLSFSFSNAQLAAANVLGNGTPLQLDLIDSYQGGWGWVALDNVTINGVPEPASAATLAIGAVGALVIRRRRVTSV